ncbi:hypothetical protein SAMN04487897_1099 [Paenibacillus sp. yr247]|uniref:hypothetical protein n=1 Tax=Paenibacillus sp. yr247 TaxID=1761880 RepID=UPI0008842299|nr:hypothetical protein [Paenibacillus sp. yr247]SDO14954.1 hypothetical protein SAMN04487897_1099 [Paenibacillus sp. yr247]
MPLFVINKIPVALTWKNDNQLREEIFGVDGVSRSYIQIYGKKDNTYKLQKKLLNKKCRENRDDFIKNYAMFDLSGEEASDNLWDLVYDYCAYHGSGYTSDARNFVEQLGDDYMGDNYLYPQGKVFYLDHYAAPYNLRWKLLRRKKGKIIRTVIDARNVVRVVGSIDEFSIIYKDKIVKCGEIFEVISNLRSI